MQFFSNSNIQRTPEELRVRWFGHSYPGINHEPWTSDEIAHLADIIASQEESNIFNWVDIAATLGVSLTFIIYCRFSVNRTVDEPHSS